MSPIAFESSNPFPLHSCKLHALLSAAHVLLHACLLYVVNVKLVPKLHLNFKETLKLQLWLLVSNQPPLDTSTARSYTLQNKHW